MSARPLSCPPISEAHRALRLSQGWRAIGLYSMVSPEFEIDEEGKRTGRSRVHQFAIAWDETSQRRGAFATSEGDARGPQMYPRQERFR